MKRCFALAGAVTTLLLSALGTSAASPTPQASPEMLTWDKWRHLAGVFDLGLQRDGLGLIAEGSELLFTVNGAGTTTSINTGGSFQNVPGYEAYFAVSAGEPIGGSCPFQHGAIYVLDPRTPRQVLEVDPNTGHPMVFATVAGVDSLNGIAFDDTGSFGDHPLLVTGPGGGHGVVAAIDCHGAVNVITATAPRMEGGISVAPSNFGSHAGELIAPDEIGGNIIGIRPTGTTSVVVTLTQPAGQDLGVESGGFVPRDFLKQGGFAYVSDRGTANNPHAGTDSILRLSSGQLSSAGVDEGDLVMATEGGAATADVKCASSCSLSVVANGPAAAHVEGHVVFLTNHPGQAPPAETPPSPHPKPSPSPVATTGKTDALGLGLAGAGIVLILVVVALVVRRTAGSSR